MLNRIGERTLPWVKTCFPHLLCSLLVSHRIFYWTTFSGDLYIVDCPVLCTGWGSYGSPYHMLQWWSYVSGNHVLRVESGWAVGWCMTFRGGIKPAWSLIRCCSSNGVAAYNSFSVICRCTMYDDDVPITFLLCAVYKLMYHVWVYMNIMSSMMMP